MYLLIWIPFGYDFSQNLHYACKYSSFENFPVCDCVLGTPLIWTIVQPVTEFDLLPNHLQVLAQKLSPEYVFQTEPTAWGSGHKERNFDF